MNDYKRVFMKLQLANDTHDIRINLDHLVSYAPNDYGNTVIIMSNGGVYHVTNNASEIDRRLIQGAETR